MARQDWVFGVGKAIRTDGMEWAIVHAKMPSFTVVCQFPRTGNASMVSSSSTPAEVGVSSLRSLPPSNSNRKVALGPAQPCARWQRDENGNEVFHNIMTHFSGMRVHDINERRDT